MAEFCSDEDTVSGEIHSQEERDAGFISRARARVVERLLAERNSAGHWTGELSSSALSTATAMTALILARKNSTLPIPQAAIESGGRWLAANRNSDGGWGDTVRSRSNLSTTTLCWAALGAAGARDEDEVIKRAKEWIRREIGFASGAGNGADVERFRDALTEAIIRSYGKDRTFSVPILTLCALAGRLGEGADGWRRVIALPFELAAFPRRWFAALRLPVVSYALPALIAIGQARHFHRPPRNPVIQFFRNLSRERTLKILAEIQPSNGGFLEATPLTSFVVMSLAGSGQASNVVTRKGVEFLLGSQRPEGSWPIDTNLATWVTTLSINALGKEVALAMPNSGAIRKWILGQQYRGIHPYTGAAPGGWAWTDLPGGVPDADDTAGALLALKNLAEGKNDPEVLEAVSMGAKWLLGLQNSDGGIPTFCRGWGALPFDRSAPDLTAHAIRAWLGWAGEVGDELKLKLQRAMSRGVEYLRRTQGSDGSWVPLWFGNQFDPDLLNRTYGTARVLVALAECARAPEIRQAIGNVEEMILKGVSWLESTQTMEGGWSGTKGGPPSIEETALSIEALAEVGRSIGSQAARMKEAAGRGAAWLAARMESGQGCEASPIGFYFARLWYFESMYPLVFAAGALRSLELLQNGRAIMD